MDIDSEFEWKDADVGTGRQEVWKKSKEEIHGLGNGFLDIITIQSQCILFTRLLLVTVIQGLLLIFGL